MADTASYSSQEVMSTTTEEQRSLEMDLVQTKLMRKYSVASTDSFDSEGQLCTEDHCIMDAKNKPTDKESMVCSNGHASDCDNNNTFKITCHNLENCDTNGHFVQKRNILNTDASFKNGAVPGTLQYKLQHNEKPDKSTKTVLSGQLCKSCGGEMQKEVTDSEAEELKETSAFRYGYQKLLRFLSQMMPAWLCEPEFMVHPKPRINRTIVHGHADSLFSTDSGFTNYYGILNLCLILLVLNNARLFLENIIKYGILFNLSFTGLLFENPNSWPNLLLTLGIGAAPALALLTEKAISKGYISEKTGFVIYGVNLTTLIFFPAAVIYYVHPIIVFSIFTLGNVTILFLKLVSYAQTNSWCREHHVENKRRRRRSEGAEENTVTNNGTNEPQVYPNNLTVKDIVYFIFAPTLCYELNFPRSARIRKRFLVKRILEMVFLSWLMVALMQQWIVPAVANSRQSLAEMEFFKSLERLLKLSIPNHFIWLIFFYWMFHSSMNVVAELLRFGDRTFYKDWWNAETVNEFWQLWNIPVHRWAHRHVYKPLLKRGINRLAASTIVFFLSAFFHEYLVSVPLRMFKIWAFSGMIMQVPTAIFTAKYFKGKWGNIIVWLTLILGQPVAILAYFHDYYIVNHLPFASDIVPNHSK